jgi:hypothetical protein
MQYIVVKKFNNLVNMMIIRYIEDKEFLKAVSSRKDYLYLY